MGNNIILYNYFRSSASYRVRIALNLKNLKYDYKSVHLLKDGGEQFKPEYKKLNPMSQVPCLVHNGHAIGQSIAIINYLESAFPQIPLFPNDPYLKAKVLEFCEIINSGMQPLQNLQVLAELSNRFEASQEQKESWTSYWMKKGFEAIDVMLKEFSGKYCFGDQISAADCFLAPQFFAAGRFKYDISPHKKVIELNNNYEAIHAFADAHPTRQPDYQA